MEQCFVANLGLKFFLYTPKWKISQLFNFSGRRQVMMSLVGAWLIGFVYIVTSYTSTSKVDDGSCVIYYFPNEMARKVCMSYISKNRNCVV